METPENGDNGESGVKSDSIPVLPVSVNLGTVERFGVQVGGVQFESPAATTFHYMTADVLRAFVKQIGPQMLALADELDRLNGQRRPALVVPKKGLFKP